MGTTCGSVMSPQPPYTLLRPPPRQPPPTCYHHTTCNELYDDAKICTRSLGCWNGMLSETDVEFMSYHLHHQENPPPIINFTLCDCLVTPHHLREILQMVRFLGHHLTTIYLENVRLITDSETVGSILNEVLFRPDAVFAANLTTLILRDLDLTDTSFVTLFPKLDYLDVEANTRLNPTPDLIKVVDNLVTLDVGHTGLNPATTYQLLQYMNQSPHPRRKLRHLTLGKHPFDHQCAHALRSFLTGNHTLQKLVLRMVTLDELSLLRILDGIEYAWKLERVFITTDGTARPEDITKRIFHHQSLNYFELSTMMIHRQINQHMAVSTDPKTKFKAYLIWSKLLPHDILRLLCQLYL